MLDRKPAASYGMTMFNVPKPATKNSVGRCIRFRSRKELETIARAAKAQNISFNTFVIETVSRAADGVLEQLRGTTEGSDLKATA